MRTQKSLLLAVILVAGFSCRVFASLTPSTQVPVKISLPTESLDLSDLDARDEFNRPIRRAPQARILERLFTNKLNQMLMLNLTQTKQRLWSLLSQTKNVLAGFLQRMFNRFNEKIHALFVSGKASRTPPGKRISHVQSQVESHRFMSLQAGFTPLAFLLLASIRIQR